MAAIPASPVSNWPAGAGVSRLQREQDDATRIGALLIAASKMKAEEVARVLDAQKGKNLLFGEAAISLGLITQKDVGLVLSRQQGLPDLAALDVPAGRDLVSLFAPQSPSARALVGARSQLLMSEARITNRDLPHVLTIASPNRNEGRSFVAANLAVLFSRLGMSTLLVDANLHAPRQHAIFGTDSRQGLTSMLSGRVAGAPVVAIGGLPGLHLLSAGAPVPHPHDLLERSTSREKLLELAAQYDQVILDAPCAAEHPEWIALCMMATETLLVARRDRTAMADAASVASAVRNARGRVAGVLMNQFN